MKVTFKGMVTGNIRKFYGPGIFLGIEMLRKASGNKQGHQEKSGVFQIKRFHASKTTKKYWESFKFKFNLAQT